MHRHHFFISLIVLVAIGAGIFFVTNKGLYPVAIVDSKIIYAKDFRRMTESAFAFYTKALEIYKKQELTVDEGKKLFNEIRRATLEKLVEQAIVDRELSNRLGGAVELLIDNKLKSVENSKISESAPSLYGLSAEEFQSIVLAPEAAIELLSDNFKSKNEDFASWLKNQKQTASVYILIPGFSWKGSALELK